MENALEVRKFEKSMDVWVRILDMVVLQLIVHYLAKPFNRKRKKPNETLKHSKYNLIMEKSTNVWKQYVW